MVAEAAQASGLDVKDIGIVLDCGNALVVTPPPSLPLVVVHPLLDPPLDPPSLCPFPLTLLRGYP
jgi:hypothetical protein